MKSYSAAAMMLVVAFAAVELSRQVLGDLSRCTILLVGTGGS